MNVVDLRANASARRERDLTEVIRRDALNALSVNGFYLLPTDSLLDDEILVSIGKLLGLPFGEPRDPRVVRAISPVDVATAPKNTLSSRYGFGAFPYHTDTAYLRDPAELLLLYCAEPGLSRRATALVDTRSWFLTKRETHTLRNEVWAVRGGRPPFLCTVGGGSDHLQFRYDRNCMAPAVRGREESRDIFDEHVDRATPTLIHWSRGDLLLLDNRRIVHARTAANQLDPDRILKRVLIRTGDTA